MILLAIGLILLAALLAGAPYVPSRRSQLAPVFDALGPGQKRLFVDLGCGDGRVLQMAAERGFQAVGYEINPLLVGLARLRLRGVVDVRLLPWQLADLAQADIIYIFSTSWHLKHLDYTKFPANATVVMYGPQPDEWDQEREATAVGPAVIYRPTSADGKNKLP